MNLLNLKKLAATLTVACSLAFASSASAALLDLSSSNYLGSINPGSPAGGEDEEGYINTLVGLDLNEVLVIVRPGPDQSITRSGNAIAGLVEAVYSDRSNTGDVTDFNLTGTTSYILAKYGNVSYAWFVLGYVGEIEVLGTIGNGLSHVSFFGGTPTTRVPDSASTLLLIGLGLASVGFVARRRKA